MWIEIDFDERWFPEPVWDALYLNAKALRHVLGKALGRVRVTARQHVIGGEQTRFIAFTINLRLGEVAVSKTIEFGPHGYWRLEQYLADVADAANAASAANTATAARAATVVGAADEGDFRVFKPQAKFEFERDLINRPELRLDVLYDELRVWLEEVVATHPEVSRMVTPIIRQMHHSATLAASVWQKPGG